MKKNTKKYYNSKLFNILLFVFLFLSFLSFGFLIISIILDPDELISIKKVIDSIQLFQFLLSIKLKTVSSYSNVFIGAIITVGVALITIDATVFIFSKSAIDRINDENNNISDIVKIHRESNIKLLFRVCRTGVFIILLPIIWHFVISFFHTLNVFFLTMGFAFLSLGTLVYVLMSFLFLKRCVKNEKYLRYIIKDEQKALENELLQILPKSSSYDRLSLIGDWASWDEESNTKQCDFAKTLCKNMTPDSFINQFQRAEKLLISFDNCTSQEMDIVTSFSERASILEAYNNVETNDLNGRTYPTDECTGASVYKSITDIEKKLNFNRQDQNHEEYFNNIEKTYLILKKYCDLLISKRYARKIVSRERDNYNKIIWKLNIKRKIKDSKDKNIGDMNLPLFAEAYYYFYLNILSVFVSSVHISNYSFNNTSLKYADFYSSKLDNISLYGVTFFRTILSRTSLQKVILDLSLFKDVDFYCTILTESSLNNSNLNNICFEHSIVEKGGFDSCMFQFCIFTDSDFNKSIFNNSEFVNICFKDSNFIDSSFREISVKKSKFDSCSFEKSELYNWETDSISMHSCDFSMSSWSEMSITGWDLSNSIFNEASLAGIKIKETKMEATSFNNCKLTETTISDCNLNGSTLQNASLFMSNVTRTDFSMTDLTRANSVKTKYVKSDLSNSNCEETDFSEAIFKSVTFKAARLYNASLTRSYFNDCSCQYLLADRIQFTFAKCIKCDYSYSSFSESNFTESVFKTCDFTGSYMTELNATKTMFVGCTLKNVDFSDTRFVKAKFIGSDPDKPMIIKHCDFSNCKFESVDFYNVLFYDCIVNNVELVDCKNHRVFNNKINKFNIKNLFITNHENISII